MKDLSQITLPEKTFQIVFGDDVERDEIVDSIADLLEIAVIVERELGDGVQLTDFLAALKLQPIVKEIVDDVPKFVDQLKRLDPALAQECALDAYERIRMEYGTVGKVAKTIINSIYITAGIYSFAYNTYLDAYTQFKAITELFAGKFELDKVTKEA